ncbi:hypothetical protein CHS0354_022655 [Potamilus streckersoni]|uniref:Proline-, glutamic acid- and leucine-rich protein 1 n=1 Tax=Potamilus streckersoni TaxID=2493646 RepID=A0AAE0WC21_9BIVA|nr:hypothetical protein CHS0354_022655 [Potamilus streckersoni]
MEDYREHVVSTYKTTWLEDDRGQQNILSALDIAAQHQLFALQKKGSCQEILSYIHDCLNSYKNSGPGLLLLSHLIKECSTEVFMENAMTWLRLCTQIIQSYNKAAVHSLACDVCANILSIATSFTDLSREITSSVIPQLLPPLLIANKEWRQFAFICINSCIRNFSGSCGPFKNKIEACVLEDIRTCKPCKAAVVCFSLLARCGGGGNQGVKYTEGWKQQCDQLTDSMSHTLSLLYDGMETDKNLREQCAKLIFTSTVPDSLSERLTNLVGRWKVLCDCLSSLLSESFPAVVNLPIERILGLICRTLSVHGKMLLSRPTTERVILASLIPAVHESALEMLKVLFTCCKGLLIPFTRVISDMISQELSWTKSVDQYGQEKPYGQLRRLVYECVITWCQNLDSNTGITGDDEAQLIHQILHDLTPQMDILKIDSSKSSQKPGADTVLSGKKKKGGYSEISKGISTQRKVDLTANAALVSSGLAALNWLLTTSGSSLGRKALQGIQEFVITTLLTIHQSIMSPPIPYTDSECRQSLYRVLLALSLLTHHTVPPPLQCALGLFRTGLLDTSLKVSSFCIEASRVCEALIHPRVPCLNGPIVCDSLVHIGNQKIRELSNGNTYQSEEDSLVQHEETLPMATFTVLPSSSNISVTDTAKHTVEDEPKSDSWRGRKRSFEETGGHKGNGNSNKQMRVDEVISHNVHNPSTSGSTKPQNFVNNQEHRASDLHDSQRTEAPDDGQHAVIDKDKSSDVSSEEKRDNKMEQDQEASEEDLDIEEEKDSEADVDFVQKTSRENIASLDSIGIVEEDVDIVREGMSPEKEEPRNDSHHSTSFAEQTHLKEKEEIDDMLSSFVDVGPDAD